LVVLTVESVVGSAVIIAVLALLFEGGSRVIRRFGKRAGLRETTLISIRDISRAIWVVLAIVGVAFYTGLTSDLTVLAVSTVGGLILSLALQATLSNVIAGIFMFEDGTLRVGDEVTYSGIKGTVVRIALRTTWIITEMGVIVAVSNSNLMGGPLTIHTATTRLVPKYHLEGLVQKITTREVGSEKPGEKAAVPGPGKSDGKVPDKRTRKDSHEAPEQGGS
jgi:small-conductance mechanosensitive channel